MQVAEHPDEDFLDQILRPLAIADGSVDEVQQPRLITVHEGAEGLGIARQVLEHQSAVVELVECLALARPGRRHGGAAPVEGRSRRCSH